jgi:two-component system, cell cycle sensor histidine kinase PleC
VTGSLRITIADTGIGIAEADLQRVLRPFEQIESQFQRKHEGTGLGLPLAKVLTELHGGTLHLESVLGEGTCVTVTLPATRVRPREHTAPVQPAGSAASDQAAAA